MGLKSCVFLNSMHKNFLRQGPDDGYSDVFLSPPNSIYFLQFTLKTQGSSKSSSIPIISVSDVMLTYRSSIITLEPTPAKVKGIRQSQVPND